MTAIPFKSTCRRIVTKTCFRGAVAAALLAAGTVSMAHASALSGRGVESKPRATASQPSPALFNRTTLDYSSKLSLSQEAHRYRVMVLQPGDGSLVKLLHAANPKLIVLMFTDPLYSSKSDPSSPTFCTSYATDYAKHRSWFLRSQTGQAISTPSDDFLMDMGNSAYERACVTGSLAVAKKYGFNGIMLYNLNASWSWLVSPHVKVEKYLSDASWVSAMQSFLNYAGKTVHASHLKVMANLAAVSPSLWRRWTSPLDGSELQGWTVGNAGARQQVPYWPTKLADVAWSEAHHKYAILDSYSETAAGNVYGLASMLLVANGYSSYATDNTKIFGSHEGWFTQYAYATQLGASTGRYKRLSNRVYKRTFKNGIVLVNPTTGTVRRVSLGGAYYDGSRRVSSVSIGPTSGFILLKKRGSPSSSDGSTSSSSSSSGSSSKGGSSTGGSSTGGSTSGSSSGGGSSSGATATALGPSPALFNRTAYVYESQLSIAQEAARYQVMILTSFDASTVAALHAANPNLKILMYSMALYSNTNDSNGLETCTSYASDNADDPSWFLLNQNGNRMSARNGDDYMMDMGNAGYQQSCVAHTIALAKQDGFDGVFFDGINSYWQGFVPTGSTVVKYPSKPTWQAAMQSFLTYAGQTIQANGLLAFANLGGASSSTLWDPWSAPLNGSQEQGFTDGGEGLAQQVPDWAPELANDAWSEAHGKYVIEDSYNQTEAGNTYGLASVLLVADGYSSWSTSNSDDTASGETWYPEYTDAQQLGSPTGAYTKLSNGVYERHFQNGIVVVNPTTSSVSSFSLGGTYYGTTTSSTSTVSLPATSGLILLQSP